MKNGNQLTSGRTISVCRLLQTVAVFIGTHTGNLSENAGKMCRVGISYHLSDISDPQSGIRQEFLGSMDALCIQKIIKIFMGLSIE